MLSELLCAKRRKSHNLTKYCESIIKSVEIKQMAVQHYSYDQHLSQFWNHLVKYFRTGRPIQTDNSNGIGGGRTTLVCGGVCSNNVRYCIVVYEKDLLVVWWYLFRYCQIFLLWCMTKTSGLCGVWWCLFRYCQIFLLWCMTKTSG